MAGPTPPPPPPPPPPPSLGLQDIKAVSVLGRGAKGVVFLVRAGSESLALKVVSRTSVEQKKGTTDPEGSHRRIWFERDVLLALRHPLLPTLRGVVETGEIVGFAIDPCSGGDLSALRRRQTEKMFSDDIIRFFAAELVLALEHLHGLGIVYRDLKPENVLIRDNGHLMLVDFDLSTRLPTQSPDPPPKPQKPADKHRSTPPPRRRRLAGCFTSDAGVSPETETASSSPSPDGDSGAGKSDSGAGKSNSFVGTEEYVSPEVIEGKGHDFAVDWWGLGVVLYEMLYGRTPFRGQNRKETFYRILTKVPELVGERTPLRDLIARLLDKDPATRIAGDEIKQHEFFRGVDWESVLEISRPPFIPPPPEEEEEEDDDGTAAIDMENVVRDIFQLQNTKEDNKTQEEEAKTGDFPVF